MQFAMEEIAIAFEKEHGTQVDLIISSSGKLTSQIEQGAPFDVFVSADMKYPQYLYDHNLTTKAPEIYAYGQLVLWTLNEGKPSIESLTNNNIEKIAIANPKTAPYGQASMDVLKTHGLYLLVENKLIYGESVSQCNQFISTKSADIGFTSMSTVLAPNMKTTGHWIKIDSTDHSPITQGVVVLKKSKKQKEAQLFYDFLMSDLAQNILAQHGYMAK